MIVQSAMRSVVCVLGFAGLVGLGACDDSIPVQDDADGGGAGSSSGGGANGADAAPPDFSSGVSLDIDVAADRKTFVRLDQPAVVAADRATSTDWDLAFIGYNVYTNSGPSGPGASSAFGPLDAATFLLDDAPTGLPFMAQDKTGGAFIGWYFYDGTTHYLWSRFHTFGVKDGNRLWKVQIVTYYGERNGGPVSALYKVRYAELTGGTTGPTQAITLDGTAGGTTPTATDKSGCVDLGTGAASSLTPAEAAASSAWHLCARRDVIAVNGGVSGPRGATSTDLDVGKIPTETLEQVKVRTEASETATFDAIVEASFASSTFLPDGVVSAFRDLWLDKSATPPARGTGAWLVKSARNEDLFLVAFPEFTGSTAATPTKIKLSIKNVSGGKAP